MKRLQEHQCSIWRNFCNTESKFEGFIQLESRNFAVWKHLEETEGEKKNQTASSWVTQKADFSRSHRAQFDKALDHLHSDKVLVECSLIS